MRIIFFLLCILLVGSCSQQNPQKAQVYYSDKHGFVVMEGHDLIKLYQHRCIMPISWNRIGDHFVENNSLELIGCRRNPNKKHMMQLEVKTSPDIEITSRDSCFLEIYGYSSMQFRPIKNFYEALDWTHLKVTQENTNEDNFVELSRERLEEQYDSMVKRGTKPILDFDQQIWSLFHLKDKFFTKHINPREDYRVELKLHKQIIDSAQVNMSVCYLREMYKLIASPFFDDSAIGIE